MRGMTWTRIAVLAALALFVAAAGAAGDAVGAPADEKALQLETPKTPIKALDFMAVTSDGKPIRLSDYKGQVVLLNFWATWCVPCLEEMPAMEQLAQKMQGRKFKIVAVDLQETPEKVRQFAKASAFGFPLVLDPAGEISHHYGVLRIPVSYIIDGTGAIFRRAQGARPWASAQSIAFFSDLIKASALDSARPVSGQPLRVEGIAPAARQR